MPQSEGSDLRLSTLSTYTDPLPDTPADSRDRTTSPWSSRSSGSTPYTAPLPPTPQSAGPSTKSRKDESSGVATAASPRPNFEAESPLLPLTPEVELKDATASAGVTRSTTSAARSGRSATSSGKSTRTSKSKRDQVVASKGVKGEEQVTGNVSQRTIPTWKHKVVRMAALYLVPVASSIPLSLILALTRLLLQPIYNSTPLSLHSFGLYAILTLVPTIFIWHTTRNSSPRNTISARVCFSVSAIGGDLIAISGRRVGSLAGKMGGPEWGAFGARAVLGLAVVGGGTAFAVLCSDYVLPLPTGLSKRGRLLSFPNLLLRSTVYVAHIWLGEHVWMRFQSGSTSILVQSPEKSILFLSLLITLLSLLLRSTPSTSSFARNLHSTISTRLKLTKSSSRSLWTILSRLPRQVFPILLLLRLPLLVIALRQQLFLRPSPPYLSAGGTVRILSSQRGITGQIVVGEEVQRGFRFMRCDASILGGRWMRTMAGKKGAPARTDLGDSIFATFPMQEIGLLAYRADEHESVARTVLSSTGLQVAPEVKATEARVKPTDRALIIGLGVGIAAQAFSRQSLEIDMVEIDPLVYHAAVDHFGLSLPPTTTINLLDGNEYVSSLAQMRREGTYEGQKWRFVIQDCFSGGSVPEEMFTREFWTDLAMNVEQDGVVAMNFVGVLRSKASRAVLVTLISVFEQCRAFGDPAETHVGEDQSINMVVFCTNALNPLLTFRKPTPADVLHSPLRSHVYSTSQANEIQLHDVITDEDRADPELMLRRGEGRMDRGGWQVDSGLSMWYNMQKSKFQVPARADLVVLSPEMWMAF